MKLYKPYKYITAQNRAEIAELYTAGEIPKYIAAKIGTAPSTIYRELRRGFTGEVDEIARPVYSTLLAQERTKKNVKLYKPYKYITAQDRAEIAELYAAGKIPKYIAAKIGTAPSTIYRELRRGFTGEVDETARPVYSALLAQERTKKNLEQRGAGGEQRGMSLTAKGVEVTQ